MPQQMSAKVAQMHMTVCNALEDLRPIFKGAQFTSLSSHASRTIRPAARMTALPSC